MPDIDTIARAIEVVASSVATNEARLDDWAGLHTEEELIKMRRDIVLRAVPTGSDDTEAKISASVFNMALLAFDGAILRRMKAGKWHPQG